MYRSCFIDWRIRVCMYIYECTHKDIYMHVCIHGYVHVCMYSWIHTCVYVLMNTYMCVCIHEYIHVCMYSCMYLRTHSHDVHICTVLVVLCGIMAYVYTYMDVHIQIHTCKYVFIQVYPYLRHTGCTYMYCPCCIVRHTDVCMWIYTHECIRECVYTQNGISWKCWVTNWHQHVPSYTNTHTCYYDRQC